MKRSIIGMCCLLAGVGWLQAQEVVNLQDSTGMPGDNFSLQGALQLFQESSSLEDFEQKLNTESLNVNNLDLNQDGEVDYIRVEDHMEGNAHAIVLQVPVNENESQDVAVIEIEKDGDESAIAQIVGEEEIFGEALIYEPLSEPEMKSKGKGPSTDELLTPAVVVNVWAWPTVRVIYAPGYRPWVSPWRWRTYPNWWRPWRPVPWRRHWAYCSPYRVRFGPAPRHRVVVAHGVYRPHRRTSVVVVNHYHPHRQRYAPRPVVAPGPRGQKRPAAAPRGGGRRR